MSRSPMTWYMMAVAAIEAAGAALLPTGPDGLVGGLLLAGVVVAYGVCLLPTWVVAGGPGWPGRRVGRRCCRSWRRRCRRRWA